ncbi:hypothetical protein BT96DRAFT_971170 [Gymnopus androsaceus JB14]|uniref:Transcription initiation factor TFIID subunit 4 n=1 Tax=Gymnopus androsaceus JB14 TaxID=1447944 RepID=A0A6A4IFB6_9AGAR|nr:hypothetical protein BT96DRAFT_971170 [Gymnopus androsaceus JB14]
MSQPPQANITPAATPQPTTQPQPPPTTYSTWANIPIDPALQQQTGQTQAQPTATAGYQYTPYPHYYQPYQNQYSAVAQPVAAAVTPQASTSTTPAPNTAIDTSDINTLKDALGSTGVDLRAEEESLQRTSDSHLAYRSYEDRTRKQPPKPSFNTIHLTNTILAITTAHKLSSPHPSADTVNYLALALRARLQDLITAMITAAHHRTDTQFDRPPSVYDDGSPMWSILVRSDVSKQLAALEKVEREEETRIRRERKERADLAAAHAAALAAQSAAMNGGANSPNPMGDDDEFGSGSAKKKRKKDGPGVTAKNMSADVQKKMSNAAASHAAGLAGRYAWMTAGASSATPAKKPTPGASATTPAANPAGGMPAGGTPGTPIPPSTTPGASSWARPYVSSKKSTTPEITLQEEKEDTRTAITMRDAMFVIQKERGHGGGRGAAKGWT